MLPILCSLWFVFPTGSASVRGVAGPSEIVITTTPRLAGAIDSLKWMNREFIDSADHGRQLQSACSFDCGESPFWAEAYNPTEAGSRRDGAGSRSSSFLVNLHAERNQLSTTSRMAFWLKPGEKSDRFPAKNSSIRSNHILHKQVQIGLPGIAHAIDYRVTFRVPVGERHTLAQFESLTGYLPAEFSTFETFNPKSGQLSPISDGPGEQGFPVVMSTPNGSHAIAAIGFDTVPNATGPSYGRWRFGPERVVKWNLVHRVRNADGVPPGEYSFQQYVAVGSRENVRVTLVQLVERFQKPMR